MPLLDLLKPNPMSPATGGGFNPSPAPEPEIPDIASILIQQALAKGAPKPAMPVPLSPGMKPNLSGPAMPSVKPLPGAHIGPAPTAAPHIGPAPNAMTPPMPAAQEAPLPPTFMHGAGEDKPDPVTAAIQQAIAGPTPPPPAAAPSPVPSGPAMGPSMPPMGPAAPTPQDLQPSLYSQDMPQGELQGPELLTAARQQGLSEPLGQSPINSMMLGQAQQKQGPQDLVGLLARLFKR